MEKIYVEKGREKVALACYKNDLKMGREFKIKPGMVEWVHFSTQNLYTLHGNAMTPLFKNESPQYVKFHLWLKLAKLMLSV